MHLHGELQSARKAALASLTDQFHAEDKEDRAAMDPDEIREYLGLDCYRQLGVGCRKKTCPHSSGHGQGIVANMNDYRDVREHLYPPEKDAFDHA